MQVVAMHTVEIVAGLVMFSYGSASAYMVLRFIRNLRSSK